MKRNLKVILILLYSFQLFSQDSKISLELNYPIPVDQNFLGKNYTGILDFGANYNFLNVSAVNVGAGLNAGVLKNNMTSGTVNTSVNAFVIQPKVYAELDVEAIDKFHPSLGIGYTLIIFDASGSVNGMPVSGVDTTQSGFNLNFGIAYDITEKIFAQVQYDFFKISLPDELPKIKFNSNINILKIGFGYRL